MCQLLGMNANTPTDVTFSFSGFAQRGGNRSACEIDRFDIQGAKATLISSTMVKGS
jgi:hypothetical protein